LWCPLLTHYDSTGTIDSARIAAHVRHLSPYVKGFLIPGSTGDGWELSDSETRKLIEIALDVVGTFDVNLLIGVLKAETVEAENAIGDILTFIKNRTGETDPALALTDARVCGFTVCPPRGKDRTQSEIENGLASILARGLPTAIYQLPQVTENEISPEVLSRLALRFENFLQFKDTSGADRVVLSGKELAGVFAVRGAEGDYARWPTQSGGPYNGFLLSTANCFAKELSQLLADLSSKRSEAAAQLSERLTAVIREAFQLASSFPHGNPFANANKAMDHFFAHGPNAVSVPPPAVHAGTVLPGEMIEAAGELLKRYDFMPGKGYL